MYILTTVSNYFLTKWHFPPPYLVNLIQVKQFTGNKEKEEEKKKKKEKKKT